VAVPVLQPKPGDESSSEEDSSSEEEVSPCNGLRLCAKHRRVGPLAAGPDCGGGAAQARAPRGIEGLMEQVREGFIHAAAPWLRLPMQPSPARVSPPLLGLLGQPQ